MPLPGRDACRLGSRGTRCCHFGIITLIFGEFALSGTRPVSGVICWFTQTAGLNFFGGSHQVSVQAVLADLTPPG